VTAVPQVPGRPAWARDEPVAVQRLIVEHALSKQQLRELREFAAAEGGPGVMRMIAYSSARALRERGFGDISGKRGAPGKMARAHPRAEFALNDAGQRMARRVSADYCGTCTGRIFGDNHVCASPEREPDVSYRNEYGGRWPR
jgi:hypothetical protein